MPAKLRLELHRSVEISSAALSPTYGCGLMLSNLPRFNASDPFFNAMSSYSYENLFADKAARKIIENSGLLKQFYDNAFTNKVALRQNFKNVYGNLDVFMAIDAAAKTAWFVADPSDRMALLNYDRDALSFGLKPLGIVLLGSTVRLTAAGWQNLHDVLTDKFLNAHPEIQKVEILSVSDGVRLRDNTMGFGVTLLNFREFPDVAAAVRTALRGTAGPELQR